MKDARPTLPVLSFHADLGGGGFSPHENPSNHARKRNGTCSG